MTLTEEATAAISNYRQRLLENPSSFDEQQKLLNRQLTEIGRRDNNVFYAVSRNSFLDFPEGELFDREEYLTFRYLFESSYAVRRALVRRKRDQLVSLAADALIRNPQIASKYNSRYSIRSWGAIARRGALKAEAQINKVESSRIFFAIKSICSNADEYQIDNPLDWIMPGSYDSQLHSEFRKRSKSLGIAWGLSPRLAEYYCRHIEAKKLGEQAAIFTAATGGAILAAWGISRIAQATNNSQQTTALASAGMQALNQATRVETPRMYNSLYGLENFPQFMAPQSNHIGANQAAFLGYLQAPAGSNPHNINLAMIDSAQRSAQTAAQTTLRSIGEIASKNYNYFEGFNESLAARLGNSFQGRGNILGADTNLVARTIGDDLVRISGQINGQDVLANIRRVGDTLRLSSM